MDENTIIELLKNSIDIPLCAALIYILTNVMKFTKISNKHLPIVVIGLGAAAALVNSGANGNLDLTSTQSMFQILKSMLLYSGGASLLFSVIHKVFPTLGNKVDQATLLIPGTKEENNK